jgi:hypothetical protein
MQAHQAIATVSVRQVDGAVLEKLLQLAPPLVKLAGTGKQAKQTVCAREDVLAGVSARLPAGTVPNANRVSTNLLRARGHAFPAQMESSRREQNFAVHVHLALSRTLVPALFNAQLAQRGSFPLWQHQLRASCAKPVIARS